MSITSVELNYLIWRYLQESGQELAAFALDKQTKCLSYEHDKKQLILSHIEPGCLVKLVQRGILFTIAKEETDNLDGQESKLSLLSALAKEDALMREVNNSESSGALNGSSGVQQERDRNAVNSTTSTEMDIDMKGADLIEDDDRKTNHIIKRVYSRVDFPESFTAQWHPSTDVFAYGTDDSKAVINAIKDGKIAETVTLNHPNIIDYSNELLNERANEITTVSWSPKGNVLVTAGVDGQLRAWSPDGKLKNVSSTAGDIETELPTAANITSKNRTLIGKLIWSLNGNYILSIDTNNQVVLLDGNHLKPLKVVRALSTPVEDITLFDACWLDDHKFALSTSKKGINIYSIVELDSDEAYKNEVYPNTHDNIEVNQIGSLPGHNNEVSCLCFNNSLKLLASCSDSDYSIRIWRSNSSYNFLELDATRDLKRAYNHLSPIICLTWLSHNDKFLLSVSMEGIINIWDGSDGKAVKSVSLTLCLEQSTLEGLDVSLASLKDMLIYTAAVSPDGKWIALGDGSGRISVWDITVGDETKENANFLKCVGLYERPSSDSNDEKPDEKAVICELSWDKSSKKVAASYRGSSSVIFDWDERE